MFKTRFIDPEVCHRPMRVYPYSLDKHYPHHYGAGSSQRGKDDEEMDDYYDGKAMAVDGSLGVNTLDALGRKHVCPACSGGSIDQVA